MGIDWMGVFMKFFVWLAMMTVCGMSAMDPRAPKFVPLNELEVCTMQMNALGDVLRKKHLWQGEMLLEQLDTTILDALVNWDVFHEKKRRALLWDYFQASRLFVRLGSVVEEECLRSGVDSNASNEKLLFLYGSVLTRLTEKGTVHCVLGERCMESAKASRECWKGERKYKNGITRKKTVLNGECLR